MGRPFVQLKYASSIDGCLDDSSKERRMFSSPEDRKAVYALRAEFDAILIGAQTLRKDRPKLTLESGEAGPQRIVLTTSGNIPGNLPMFIEGSGARIVYAPKRAEQRLKAMNVPGEIRILGKDRVELSAMLEDLDARGVKSLLVEGGARVLGEFLALGLFDRLRVAIAPQILADKHAPRIVPASPPSMRLLRANAVGAMTVLEYTRD